MNLPAQVVILAGDDRYDPAANQAEMLKAHELLNAVGRAGRAGFSAEGIVLLVPGSVIAINPTENQITNRWMELQENIFSKADQCLDIEDPVGVMLDVIHANAAKRPQGTTDAIEYFVTRLPVDRIAGERLLQRSLAAFHARKRRATVEFQTRVATALALRAASAAQSEEAPAALWYDELATDAGLSHWVIGEIVAAVEELVQTPPSALSDYVSWFFVWLKARPSRPLSLLRRSMLQAALPSWADEDGSEPSEEEIEFAQQLTLQWLGGTSIADIQRSLKPNKTARECMEARSFVLQCIPEIAYAIGLIALVYRHRVEAGEVAYCPLVVTIAAPCIRDGVDTAEKLALRHMRGLTSRQRVSAELKTLAPLIPPTSPDDSFPDVRARVRAASRVLSQGEP